MMRQSQITESMTSVAVRFVSALTGQQREEAQCPFAILTRWTYMPRPRPGVSLLGLDETARKAAHQLLATVLSRHAFAQAVTIMALEEVLDLDEAGRRGRHSDDYRVAVFGTPGDDTWAWRFEGHHLSVTATINGGHVVVAPLFLGANPHRVLHQDQLVVGPLWLEEELARSVLAEMPAELWDKAIVSAASPGDIRTSTAARVNGPLEPLGVAATDLGAAAGDQLDRLVEIYLGRLAPALAEQEYRQLRRDEITFAWEGGLRAGEGHYYRLQAPGLLIEYDNTQRDANHVHTVLRRPGADFGADLLPAHLAAEQEPTS